MTGFSWEYPLTRTENLQRIVQCYEREQQILQESCTALRKKGRQQALYIAALQKAYCRAPAFHSVHDDFGSTQNVYIGDDDAHSAISGADKPIISTQCGSEDALMERVPNRPLSRSNSVCTPSSRRGCAKREDPCPVYLGAEPGVHDDTVIMELEQSYRALGCLHAERSIRIPVAHSLIFLLCLLALWLAWVAHGFNTSDSMDQAERYRVSVPEEGHDLGFTSTTASIQQAEHRHAPILEGEHDGVSPVDLNAYGLTMVQLYHRLDEGHLALLRALTKDKANPVYYNNLAYVLMLKSDNAGEKSREEQRQASLLLRRAVDLMRQANENKAPVHPSLPAVVEWNVNAVLDRESGEASAKTPRPFLE